MSSSMYTTAEGVLVVTHVHPSPQGAPQGAGLPRCVGIQKFSKNHPHVLGTIQIMVGLTVLPLGTTLAFSAELIADYSALFVWGALIYITAGALTVAAGRYLTRPLVNAALVFCVIAALSSTAGTILYAVDAGLGPRCFGYIDYYSCYYDQVWTVGFSAIMAILNLLEGIVSLVVAGTACSATCNCNCSGEPISVVVIPAAPGLPEVPAKAQPVSQVQNNLKNPQQPTATAPLEPQTYVSVIS